ncbi:MAG TPA: carbon monoxide dehydrogenase subunit G [Alphaproteobacteria bacterium]|nr:carbon monoxide dehydrogenase subunit G [Alphaproteobacteria bacterium]
MEMSGEYRISAPRARVWEALNDADILKQCIPGCESLEKISPTEFTAKVVAKVGPVKATFTGAVKLSDLVPPTSYKISGEGKGGAAGFARGGAAVALEEAGAETVLRYTAQGNVGGKLAQIGSRLIDGAAKKLADDFFGNFAATVGGAPAPAEAAEGQAAGTSAEASSALVAEPSARPERITGLPPVVWIGGVVLLIFLLLLIFAL